VQVQIKVMNDAIGTTIPFPRYASEGAAGVDLHACITAPIVIAPDETVMVGTGLAIYLADPQYAAMILPRSGLGHKHGIVLGNTIGLIDSDYQGELMVSCWNRSTRPYTLEVGARFAQLVFTRVQQVEWAVVEDFAATTRGSGGFGSTGVSSLSEESDYVV
jgi:dUTP pyrophosphatase